MNAIERVQSFIDAQAMDTLYDPDLIYSRWVLKEDSPRELRISDLKTLLDLVGRAYPQLIGETAEILVDWRTINAAAQTMGTGITEIRDEDGARIWPNEGL